MWSNHLYSRTYSFPMTFDKQYFHVQTLIFPWDGQQDQGIDIERLSG